MTFPIPVCERCGNRLGLGLAILAITTIDEGRVERKLCSACKYDLDVWFSQYETKSK